MVYLMQRTREKDNQFRNEKTEIDTENMENDDIHNSWTDRLRDNCRMEGRSKLPLSRSIALKDIKSTTLFYPRKGLICYTSSCRLPTIAEKMGNRDRYFSSNYATVSNHEKQPRPSLFSLGAKVPSSLSLNGKRVLSMKQKPNDAIPQRVRHLIDSLYQGFNSYVEFYSNEGERLKNELELQFESSIDYKQLHNDLMITEENLLLYDSNLKRLSKLRDEYVTRWNLLNGTNSDPLNEHSMKNFANGNQLNVDKSSLSKQFGHSLASIELELHSMAGRLKIDIKAIVGFARITAGDMFEILIKHGTQKWKARGKTLLDRTQQWDSSSTIFTCCLDNSIIIKVSEVHFFSSKLLSETSFDLSDLFHSHSQLVTVDLNQIGTLKLELIFTWIPLLVSKCINVQSSSNGTYKSSDISFKETDIASNENDKKPKVVLREKKRGSSAQRQKEMWRSSTNILDSVYNEISKSIPSIDTVESLSMKKFSKSSSSSRNPSENNNNLTVTSSPGSSNDSNSSSNSIALINEITRLVDDLLIFISSYIKEYPELATLKISLRKLETVIKSDEINLSRRNLSSNMSSNFMLDDIDDNVLMQAADQAFENDSGIDSLRQAISPYNYSSGIKLYENGTATIDRNHPVGPSQRKFRQIKDKERRKSIGAVTDLQNGSLKQIESCDTLLTPRSDLLATRSSENVYSLQKLSGISEIFFCLRHHLLRCKNSAKTLSTIYGPLQFRRHEMLSRLQQEAITVGDLLRLSDSTRFLPSVSNILDDQNTVAEIQEIWLSSVYPLFTTLLVPVDSLRRQIRSHFTSLIEKQYLNIVNSVIDALINLLTDKSEWESHLISVFQFVNLFKDRKVQSFIENLSHEAWITSNLSSRQVFRVNEVMERLSQIPVVPPLESLRHISLVLICPDRELQGIIEHYLCKAGDELRSDLIICYMCLLEHEIDHSRKGACRALGVLNSIRSVRCLSFVANHDITESVRSEATNALRRMGYFAEQIYETTKI